MLYLVDWGMGIKWWCVHGNRWRHFR